MPPEETLMMRADAASLGTSKFVSKKCPRRFVANVRQQDPGVVDENVNRRFDSLSERAYVGHQTKVCDLYPDGGAASLLGDARCDLSGFVSVPSDEPYSRAEARQLRRGLLAQAGCGSCDHSRPACEVCIDARVRPPAVAKRRVPEQGLV
jgi:hypothetical protein